MADSPRIPSSRLPAFAPVPVKRRADGWTPLRQAKFIGVLAETGSVSAAAERVGMARETAYRLRDKPGAEEFARAWDAALAIAGRPSTGSGRAGTRSEGPTLSPAKVTEFEHLRRLMGGRWRPVLRRGKFSGCVREARNSELLRLLRQSGPGPHRALERLRAEESFARRKSPFCNPGGPVHEGPSASRPAME